MDVGWCEQAGNCLLQTVLPQFFWAAYSWSTEKIQLDFTIDQPVGKNSNKILWTYNRFERVIWNSGRSRIQYLSRFLFFDKEKLVIVINGFQKKSQKTPRQEIVLAQKIKKLYFDEKE